MIENTENLKKYVSVSKNFVFEEFGPYIEKADRTFLKRFVGTLYTDLKNIDETDEHKAVKEEARNLVDTSMSNFAYFLFTPFNSITMDASGMSNVTSQNRSNLTVWQMNDIRRELLRSGHEAMDDLLILLEENKEAFPRWHEKFKVYYDELLVNHTHVFEKYYTIFKSRQTYLALQPSIRLVEQKMLGGTFCSEFLEKLRANENLNDNEKLVKELLQQASVFYTIAKVAHEGIFELTATGIRMKFDLLDYERQHVVELSEQLRNKISSMNDDADQIVIQAIEYINEYKDSFSSSEGKIIVEKQGGSYRPIITDSVIGL